MESEAAAPTGKAITKRQKVSGEDMAAPGAVQAVSGSRKGGLGSAQQKVGASPEKFVGRAVQQEFEEGVFKVQQPFSQLCFSCLC